MSRQRAVLQTFWHVDPTQAVLVQNKRRITRNRIQSFSSDLRFVIRRFSLYEPGNVYAGPFFRVPPHQFFAFTPRTAVRPRASAVINDAAIARPTEAPAVPEVIS